MRGCLRHSHPNAALFQVLLCLPTAPGLPLQGNGDFGTSAFFGQLSDKPLLACIWSHGVRTPKRNGWWKIKRWAPSWRIAVVQLINWLGARSFEFNRAALAFPDDTGAAPAMGRERAAPEPPGPGEAPLSSSPERSSASRGSTARLVPRRLHRGADARAMVTAQERKILRELSAIYVVFGLIAIGVHMVSPATWDWGSVPQWITATVAVIAAGVAAVGIGIQWWLARKRAAIDFFLKTEADQHLLDAYDEFHAGVEQMNAIDIDVFCTSKDPGVRKHYFAVRRYLNIHELIAVDTVITVNGSF
jgi:hypothetical protein